MTFLPLNGKEKVGAAGTILGVTERRCSRCRAVLQAGTSLLCAACAAFVPIQHHAGPAHPTAIVVSLRSATQVSSAPIRPGSGSTTSDDEQTHDHREYDADPFVPSEYGATGGSGVRSFSSVRGRAIPGMMSPGMP